MKQKLRIVLTLLLALVVQVTFAQEKTITGTVTDGEGLPLPGVNVLIEGTNRGTQTDFDGNYSISAMEGETLVFSYVGFKTAEYVVGDQSFINVSLSEDTAQLEEVIVLGYTTKGVDEVTGSSVQLAGEEIADIPVPSVTQALQGKVAGLQISASSGTPGSIQDIRIRGRSSLQASNEPLFVINGVPVVNADAAGSEDFSSLNPLSTINSQDIASITVLKDASATAAYGARGANGVIVITTKSGVSGETQFSLSTSIGIQNDAYNKRNTLTGAQRITLLKESLVNAFGAEQGVTTSNALQWGVDNNELSSAILDYDGTDYRWSEQISNEDALTQNYTFSANGGGENGSFYASLGYNKTEATVIGVDFERITGTLNFDRKLRENIDFSSSINVSNVQQSSILERGSFFSNPFITRYLMNPLNNPYNEDGTYNIELPFGSLPNIFYVLENNIYSNKLSRAIANVDVDWEWFENFTFSNRASVDYQLSEYKVYNNRYEGDGEDINGYAEEEDDKNFNIVYQGSFNYNFEVADEHHFDITALFEYQKNQKRLLYGYGENFPTDDLTNIASTSANWDASSEYFDEINVSYLGILNYNYAGKYVFDGTFRREGSSKFVSGKRFGNFGAVGLAWNMHREDFLPEVFNELRLRGSYGLTGNSGIDRNTYQALLGYSADYDANGAALPTQFGNPDLTWEKNEIFDVGFTFGLFDNRLSGSFAYFNRRTYDLLQEVPLSLTTGFEFQNRNIGEMTNVGIEAMLSYDIINVSDFLWSMSVNYATVENEITKLALGTDGEPIDPLSDSSYKTTRVGLPAGAWYMRTWAGVDPQTGAPTWYLDGVSGEVTSDYGAAERVYQGASALPTYSGGLGTRVQFKGFFVDANVYFAGGHKIYEQYAQFYLRTNSFTLGSYNGVQELLERWQQPGDITDVPKLVWDKNNNFHGTSSRHLYEGDYVRLKNLSIGYNLPSRVLQSIGIDGLTMTLRGTNIATWVKADGLKLDPEVQATGYTSLTTPPVESYTLGINVKF